jgi:hypothetical protein
MFTLRSVASPDLNEISLALVNSATVATLVMDTLVQGRKLTYKNGHGMKIIV